MTMYDLSQFHFHDNTKCLNDKLIQECYIEKLVGIKEMLDDNLLNYLFKNNNKLINGKMKKNYSFQLIFSVN
jgi:hypothetical protein